jgi:hypothetical protein
LFEIVEEKESPLVEKKLFENYRRTLGSDFAYPNGMCHRVNHQIRIANRGQFYETRKLEIRGQSIRDFDAEASLSAAAGTGKRQQASLA